MKDKDGRDCHRPDRFEGDYENPVTDVLVHIGIIDTKFPSLI